MAVNFVYLFNGLSKKLESFDSGNKDKYAIRLRLGKQWHWWYTNQILDIGPEKEKKNNSILQISFDIEETKSKRAKGSQWIRIELNRLF